MTRKRRRLIAVIGLSALAAVFHGLLVWALVAGKVVETEPRGSSRLTGAGGDWQRPRNVVRTREDDPSRYWLGVGLLGFWGTLFAVVARLEYGSYRREPDVPEAVEPAPRSAPALTEWWQQWRELRQQRRELRREQDERSRQDRAARALDPVVRSAMDGVVRSLGARLKIAGIGWLEIVGPAPPHPRSLYVVFPAPSDLERFGVKTSKLEDSVREALCQQGYPDASLAHVSVHRTSTEVVSQSFGSDVVGQIRRP